MSRKISAKESVARAIEEAVEVLGAQFGTHTVDGWPLWVDKSDSAGPLWVDKSDSAGPLWVDKSDSAVVLKCAELILLEQARHKSE